MIADDATINITATAIFASVTIAHDTTATSFTAASYSCHPHCHRSKLSTTILQIYSQSSS